MIHTMKCINHVAVNVFWAADMQQQHQQVSQYQSTNVRKMIVLKGVFAKRAWFAIKRSAFRPVNAQFGSAITAMKFM